MAEWTKLMNLLMQLRKTCDHPYLLADAEPDPYIIGEHLVASSSKLMVVDKLLADILPKKERALIFSVSVHCLAVCRVRTLTCSYVLSNGQSETKSVHCSFTLLIAYCNTVCLTFWKIS